MNLFKQEKLCLVVFTLLFIASGSGEPDVEIPDEIYIPQLNELQVVDSQNEATELDVIENKSTVTIDFEKSQTFGSTDDVLVGVISAFAVDMQDRVYIADRNKTAVHAFDPEGTYETSIGRQGQGPAEFAAISPNTTLRIYSNRLYVPNYENSYNFFPDRIEVFNLDDFSFSHTIKLLPKNKGDFGKKLTLHFPLNFYPRNDGRLLVSHHRRPDEYKDRDSYIRYVIQDSMGTIVRGPFLEQLDRKLMVYLVQDTEIPYNAIRTFPFFEKSLFAVSGDDCIYTARSGDFKINKLSPDGDYIQQIHYPFDNLSLSKNELIRRYENEDSPLGDGVLANMIREVENLPETWPALNDLLVDDEGRLWVSTIVDDFDTYEWWVLEETGAYH